MSPPMFSPTSRPTTMATAILDTVLSHLAPLFLTSTGGDLTVARNTASHMLATYNVETEEELRLAAEVISFGFHALEALGQAMAPDLPLNRILRLRGGAVSLNRAAHRSQRKLDQLQRGHQTPALTTPSLAAPDLLASGLASASPTTPVITTEASAGAPIPVPPGAHPSATPGRPGINEPAGLIEFAREALQTGGKNGIQAWTLSRQQRRAAQRIADNFKRNQTEHIRREASRAAPATTTMETVAARWVAENPDHVAAP